MNKLPPPLDFNTRLHSPCGLHALCKPYIYVEPFRIKKLYNVYARLNLTLVCIVEVWGLKLHYMLLLRDDQDHGVLRIWYNIRNQPIYNYTWTTKTNPILGTLIYCNNVLCSSGSGSWYIYFGRNNLSGLCRIEKRDAVVFARTGISLWEGSDLELGRSKTFLRLNSKHCTDEKCHFGFGCKLSTKIFSSIF